MNTNKIKTFLLVSLLASFSLASFGFIGIPVHAETLKTNVPHTSAASITSGSYYSPVGKITYYTGQPGDNGQLLGPKDCATKGSVDNPPDGTAIYVFKGTTIDYANDPGDVVYKNDWGSLPSAVLDLRPEEFSYFGVPLSDGYFIGYYFHI